MTDILNVSKFNIVGTGSHSLRFTTTSCEQLTEDSSPRSYYWTSAQPSTLSTMTACSESLEIGFQFKVALLLYMAHNRLCPLYISEVLAPVSSTSMHRQLRSSGSSNYIRPRTRTKFGDRNFSVAGVLDQSSGIPSLSPSGQATTFIRSNVY